MSVTIKKVERRAELKRFIRFPLALYKGCPNWVPALEGDEFDTFNPKKNGAYDFCESVCYLAEKDGKTAGRIAGVINHKANTQWKEKSVRFGWLDFIEDEEVLRALIDAVEAWGREKGCDAIKGPMGFTDMDKEGLLIEGYGHLSPFTCLYNFPYYSTMLEKLGFVKDADWTQRSVEIGPELPPMYQYAGLIEQKYGIHVINDLSMRELGRRYGLKIFRMYNEAFAPLFQFAPLTDRQIKDYLDTYVPILDKRFVAVCIDKDDNPVGFCFCVPTLSRAVKKSNGRLFPFGLFRILKALRKNDTLEALIMGVLPEWQGNGVTLLMFKHLHENCIKAGVRQMILNPQLEDNFKVQSLFGDYKTEPFMRRRAYTKPI